MTNLISFTPDPNNYIIQAYQHIREEIIPGVNFYIAGGSVLRSFLHKGLGKSDIDLFFENADDLKAAESHLVTSGLQLSRHTNCLMFQGTFPALNDEGHRRSIPIQLVCSAFFPTMEKLLGDFDFTITQFGFRDGKIWCTEQALSDYHAKILRVNDHTIEKNKFRYSRILKYLEYGFEPTIDFFEKMFLDNRLMFDGGSITESLSDAIYDLS